jgi:hypothetical protein
MSNEKKAEGKLHSLITLDEFKALMGVDDREDKSNEKGEMSNEQ